MRLTLRYFFTELNFFNLIKIFIYFFSELKEKRSKNREYKSRKPSCRPTKIYATISPDHPSSLGVKNETDEPDIKVENEEFSFFTGNHQDEDQNGNHSDVKVEKI